MANQQGGAAGAASRIAVSGVLMALSALSTLSSLVCAAPSSEQGWPWRANAHLWCGRRVWRALPGEHSRRFLCGCGEAREGRRR